MGDPAPIPLPLADDEKTFASLAHALQVVGWWIAPLIIFLVKRQSKFVSFHALQALFLQLVILVVTMFAMVGWFGLIFGAMFRNGVPQPNAAPPPAVFLFMPLLWLVFMGTWVFMLVVAIVYAIKAGRGEWAEYPVLGRWARRVLKV